MPGLLYADDLVLCGELEEDLNVMERHFVEVCRCFRFQIFGVCLDESKQMINA